MTRLGTDVFYAIIHMEKLVKVFSEDCMPLCVYDEDTIENIKNELANILQVPVLEKEIWIGNQVCLHAKNKKYSIGLYYVSPEEVRIFVDSLGINENIVIESLRSLSNKFGSSLIELPDILK